MSARGVDLGLGYVSETATNARGGSEQLWRNADQWSFSTALDLQKLIGIDQAKLQITVTDRNGRNLSGDANLGTLQHVQEIYGRGQTWHWTQFWYDQQYFDGTLDWKIGRLTGGEDFASFSCEFENLSFCGAAPGNITTNAWYNWPVSQWGTRLRISFASVGYVQLGVFESNPDYLQTKYGLDLGNPPGATGVLAPVEIGWLPKFDLLEGKYKFGVWYNSSSAPDAVENTDRQPLLVLGGKPLIRKDQYGTYLNFLQQISTTSLLNPKQGASLFANATFADRRTTIVDSQIAAGVFYIGVLATRPADELGCAIGRNHLNNRIVAVENQLGTSGHVQGAEYVGELFYSLKVVRWLDLRPNIQYVHRPGGTDLNKDDLVMGLKIVGSL